MQLSNDKENNEAVAQELEVMFQQQRQQNEDREKNAALGRVNKDVEILFEVNAAETVSFV